MWKIIAPATIVHNYWLTFPFLIRIVINFTNQLLIEIFNSTEQCYATIYALLSYLTLNASELKLNYMQQTSLETDIRIESLF